VERESSLKYKFEIRDFKLKNYPPVFGGYRNLLYIEV
jgi:hypothetical protein